MRERAGGLALAVAGQLSIGVTLPVKAAEPGAIPGPLEIIASPMYPWVALGAFIGFVLNARDPNYEGVAAVLARYRIRRMPVWIRFILDLAFFVFLGPLIVTAAYSPQGLFQGITLGIAWPLVIRGALTSLRFHGSDAQE